MMDVLRGKLLFITLMGVFFCVVFCSPSLRRMYLGYVVYPQVLHYSFPSLLLTIFQRIKMLSRSLLQYCSKVGLFRMTFFSSFGSSTLLIVAQARLARHASSAQALKPSFFDRLLNDAPSQNPLNEEFPG